MGWRVTLIWFMDGVPLSALVNAFRYTSQGWWASVVLGSSMASEVPYQTMATRPSVPAVIHGMTLVAADPELTFIGVDHCVHPVEAEAHVYQICQYSGFSLAECPEARVTYVMYAFRAVSIAMTGNSPRMSVFAGSGAMVMVWDWRSDGSLGLAGSRE